MLSKCLYELRKSTNERSYLQIAFLLDELKFLIRYRLICYRLTVDLSSVIYFLVSLVILEELQQIRFDIYYWLVICTGEVDKSISDYNDSLIRFLFSFVLILIVSETRCAILHKGGPRSPNLQLICNIQNQSVKSRN